jgi:hypothetical protein
MWLTDNWLTRARKHSRLKQRDEYLQNIRSTAAYFRMDLSRFSDHDIEKVVCSRFNSLKEASTCSNIVSNIYIKAQLVYSWLQRGVQRDE